MKLKTIRRNLYKVLRKTGIPRNKIVEDASLQEDLFIDEVDMTCFLFFLETKFKVDVENKEIPLLHSVGSTIDYLARRCA